MARSVDKSWVESPIALIHTPQYETKKTDTFTVGASHMALMHNVVFRGFNSIYNQALTVPPALHPDFISYATAWTALVHSHAAAEDTDLFPAVESALRKPGYFDPTRAEHDALLAALTALIDLLAAARHDPATFVPARLRSALDALRPPFESHFRAEIPAIAALAAEPDPGPEAASAFQRWGKRSVTSAGYTDVFTFFMLHLDREFEGGMWASWPPIPALVKGPLVGVCRWWHAGWWRFAAADGWGNVRAMPEWS